MKAMNLLAAAGAAALLSGCMMEDEPALSADTESRLSAALEGYVPDGEPVSCVRSPDLRGNRSVGEQAIIFDGRGDRIWLNRVRGSCPVLDVGRALRFTTPMTQLCAGELATVFDPENNVVYGGCTLGEFEPYRRSR
jgi:hypothetical protein